MGLGSSLKASLINSLTLALLDAGIECKGTLWAVGIAYMGGQVRLDPSEEEEMESESSGVFCYSFNGTSREMGEEGECIGVDMKGNFTEDQVSFLFFSLGGSKRRRRTDGGEVDV